MNKPSLLEDFVQFKSEPSLESRVQLTTSICKQFNDGAFRPQEKKIVKDILDYLSKDVETQVRKALADTLKENPDLPHKIAIRLACDVEEVSEPILQFSSVLSDDDLEEIINSSRKASVKLQAIARRHGLSQRISSNIVESGNGVAVEALFENRTAKISDQSLNLAMDLFKEQENVLGVLVKRGGLNTSVAERLVTMVSAKLKSEISARYNINPDAVNNSIKDAKEKVVLGSIVENADEESTVELVEYLHKQGKLTHSIILRALCRADLTFFEAGISKLAGIPRCNATKLIHHGDTKGFEALFHASSMPSTMMQATEALLKIIIKNKKKEGEKPALYSKRIIQEIVSNHYDRDIPNMQYYLALIASCAVESSPAGLH